MHIFPLSTLPNAHPFTVECTLLRHFLWFLKKYCHLLFSLKIYIILYIYLFLPSSWVLILPFSPPVFKSPPPPLPTPYLSGAGYRTQLTSARQCCAVTQLYPNCWSPPFLSFPPFYPLLSRLGVWTHSRSSSHSFSQLPLTFQPT